MSARRTRGGRRSRCLARGSRLGRRIAGVGWPTADDLETVAPGRRAAFWAHDHHALLASRSALTTAGLDRATADPSGGVIRRDADGAPEGVLYEAATRLVTRPRPADHRRRSRAADRRGLARAPRAGRRGRARPGRRSRRTRTWTGRTRPTRGCPSSSGCRSGCWRRCATTPSTRRSPAGCAAARSSARTPRSCPDRLAEMLRGWVARIADGGPAGRHRTGTRSAARARAPAWRVDHRARRAARAGRAGGGRRHRDPDPRASATRRSGPRSTRSSRRPRRVPFMPKVEHVQLLDPADVGRFAAAGIVASVQPVAPGVGCRAGSTAVGRPGRAQRLRLGVDRRRPGPSSPSGRTRRSSRSIRGPGSRWRSVARIARWPAGTPAVRARRGAEPRRAPCGPPVSDPPRSAR